MALSVEWQIESRANGLIEAIERLLGQKLAMDPNGGPNITWLGHLNHVKEILEDIQVTDTADA